MGRAFACVPGCGFCCTTSPMVRADEASRLAASPAASHVVRRSDGSLGLRLRTGRAGVAGAACVALRADRACSVYEHRPDACRLFPFHVYAGRRVQVVANLACPGVGPAEGTAASSASPLADAAAGIVARVLAAPDAAQIVAAARASYREFDRRLRSLGEPTDEVALARAFRPAIPALLHPDGLAGFYSGLAPGLLVAEDAAELSLTEPAMSPEEFLAEVLSETFPTEAPPTPNHVDASLTWLAEVARPDGRVDSIEYLDDGPVGPIGPPVGVDAALLPWDDAARRLGEAYMTAVTRRDHTGGVAARMLDRMSYGVSHASAYGRVLADASAGLLLRAGVVACRRGADEVAAADAREAVGSLDMFLLSLPALGAVL